MHGDEETVLDYLKLSPTVDIDATYAYVVEHNSMPIAHPWLWVEYRSQLRTLFAAIINENFVRVLEWFFGQHTGATLTHALPQMLISAARRRRVHHVELLLTSQVFETLPAEIQQLVMRDALHAASNADVSNQLIAHGLDVHSLQTLDVCRVSVSRSPSAIPWVIANGMFIAEESRISVVGAPTCNLSVNLDLAKILRDGLPWGQKQNVEWLLEHAFLDLDARVQEGKTLLMKCMEPGGSWVMLKSLLELGASATVRDEEGRTALYIGVWHGNTRNIEMLLEHILASGGKTAIHNDHTAMRIAWDRLYEHGNPQQMTQVITMQLSHGSCRVYLRELRQGLANRLMQNNEEVDSTRFATCDCLTNHQKKRWIDTSVKKTES